MITCAFCREKKYEEVGVSSDAINKFELVQSKNWRSIYINGNPTGYYIKNEDANEYDIGAEFIGTTRGNNSGEN